MPDNLVHVYVNTTSINVTWDDQPYRDHYLVSIAPKMPGHVEVSEPAYLFNDLTPGNNYTITVSAVSGDKVGENATYWGGTGQLNSFLQFDPLNSS